MTTTMEKDHMGTISILLERETNGFHASVLGLPDCQAQGATREDALSNVQKLLSARLESAEVVTIPLDSLSLPKLAGLFKDDPQWDEFQAAMASYRQEVDAELEAEYLQSDQASSVV
ncbi:MAG: type II toxin-antitoxin system HicB family antitoxin [Phormidesmis sp. CAN_BIN36]|nr:type II toxin-antitoxin system HicB family antitoxin [Phormidesmis sp. CAN_BIN36]